MSESSDKPLSRILSGSTVILAGSIINKIIAFVGSVFIARIIGDMGYGVLVIALSVYFIFSNFLTLGLNSGIARNYPQAETDSKRRGILVAAFRIGTVTGILGGIVVFLAANPIATYVFDDPSIALPLRLLGVVLPLKIILNLANGSFQAIKKPEIKMGISSVIQPIIRIILIISFVIAGFGIVGVAGAYTVAIATAAVLSLYFVWRYTTLFDFDQQRQIVYKPLLAFSIPLVGSTILVDLMNNIDTLLLGALSVSADVGQYNVAFVLSQTTLLFFQTLGFMYVPEISELHSNDKIEQAAMVYRTITKWVLFISVPFILTAVAFPEFVLTFIYSEDYAAATVPFLILIGGFITHILNGPNHSTLTAFGDTRQIFLFDTVTMVLNIILNLSLIPRFGIAGAAVATTMAYFIRNGAMTWYLNKSYQIHPFSRWLLVPLIPVIIAAAPLRWAINEPSLFLVSSYTLILVIAIIFGYLSSGIEKGDLILAENLEDKTPIDLELVKRIHERLR